jgi:hypothetical protein
VAYPDLGNLLRLISDLTRNYRGNITELSRSDLLESIYFIKNYNTVQNSDLEINLDNRLYDKFTSNFPPFDPDAYYAKPTLYISHLRNHSTPSASRQDLPDPLIIIFGDPDMIFRQVPDLKERSVIVRENNYFID